MIEGIKEIGEKILSEAPEKFLESLVLNDIVPSEKQGRKQCIVIIEFDTAKGTINFDFEEIKGETSKKYLWIGNAASNNPQDRFATINLEYLVSQTIPNFRILMPGGELEKLFERLKEKFYRDLGPQKGQKERYRYVWNIGKMGIISEDKKELWKKVLQREENTIKGCLENLEQKRVIKKEEKKSWEKAINDPQEMVKIVTKEVFAYLRREKNLNKKDISLFTVKVDGQLLIDMPEYRNYIENSMIPDFGIVLEKARTKEGFWRRRVCKQIYLSLTHHNVIWCDIYSRQVLRKQKGAVISFC